MSVENNASKVEQNVASALETDDQSASNRIIEEVNKDLSTYTPQERDYIENNLAADGLLPDIAIKTGLVESNEYVTKEDLSAIADSEGNTSLKGMAARYLVENFNKLSAGGATRFDIDADNVEGFDGRLDLGVKTAQAMREYPGLLDLAKGPDGNASKDGLTGTDIAKLLEDPSKLTEDQKEALGFMKDHFDYMKTPRGIWQLTDWTTPRITTESLDDYVDTGVPLGFRKQLETAQQDYSEKAPLKLAAEQAVEAQEEAARQAALKAEAEETARQAALKAEAEKAAAEAAETARLAAEQAKLAAEENNGEPAGEDTKPKPANEESSVAPVVDDGKGESSQIVPGATEERDKAPDEFGPNRRTAEELKPGGAQEEVVPRSGYTRGAVADQSPKYERNESPDDFGPQRRTEEELNPTKETTRDQRFYNFADEQREKEGSQDAPQEKPDSGQEEPKYKTIKLKADASVQDFARSQLGTDASDDDVKALSDKIINANESLNAPGDAIEAGAEIRVPEELELRAVDRVYKVQPGDNLWNISKGHLKERDGTAPSNREILDMVNKIVERNSIPNPDLIYPDQEIFIPGEVPEEVEPPEEVPPPEEPEEPDTTKEKLVKLAEEQFGDEPEKFEDFKKDMERFEERKDRDGLSDGDVENTYKEVTRLLETEGDTPLKPEQREKLAQQILFQAANPNQIDQGRHNTCNMNTVEVRTYTRQPAAAAKLVVDVATTGKYTSTDGVTVEIDPTPHGQSKNPVRYDGARSHASEIFQVTGANLHLDIENNKSTPPKQYKYVQKDSIPGSRSGEGIMDMSETPPKLIKDSPNVNTGNLGNIRDVYAKITGVEENEIVLGHEKYVSDRSDGVKRIESEAELTTYLQEAKDAGKFPIVVAVETTNEPFWTDSGGGAAGGSGGGHVLTITDYEPGPPGKVTMDNSWGTDDDHDARRPVDVHDLYLAMQRPSDSVEIMKTDAEAKREAGEPDHWSEFEIVRMERIKRTALTESEYEDYADEMKETMSRASEDWTAGKGLEGKDEALTKMTAIIRSLPTEQRDALEAHRLALGI